MEIKPSYIINGLKEEITSEIRKFFEMNENKYTTYQNVCDAAKAVLKGGFIPINAYVKKEEISQINNLTFYLKILENEEQIKPKASRRKEIIMISK